MNTITRTIQIVFHGAFDTSTPEGRSKERARRIALTAVTGAMAQVLAMAIPLITVRVTYSYLGEEIYGLWSAVTSFFTLFNFADLGLGNGLKTRLSQAFGQEDNNLSQRLISSTFSVLILVAGLLMLVFLVVYPFVNWSAVMNAETEKAMALAGGVVFAIVIPRLLGIPLALVNRTQMALQEGYRSNLWQCAAIFLSLTAVYVVARHDLGPLAMIWASSLIVVVVSALNLFFYFRLLRWELRPKVRMIDTPIVHSLLKTGLGFFTLSILTTIGLSLDNFIVANAISLTDAATYSILFRVVHMISLMSTMISNSLWAANGEALARGETGWVKRNTRRMSLALLAFSISASLGILAFSRPFFRIWLGTSFEFSYLLLLGMCAMQVLLSFISPYFMVLNASGIVRKQIAFFAWYTPCSFMLKYFLAIKYGAAAIPWTGVFCYSAMILPQVFIITRRLYGNKLMTQGEKI